MKLLISVPSLMSTVQAKQDSLDRDLTPTMFKAQGAKCDMNPDHDPGPRAVFVERTC